MSCRAQESGETARLAGQLPGGPEFSASISLDVIALRVGDRTCLAAPRWMSADQVREAACALLTVAPVDGERRADG